jgi:HAAS
MMEMTPAARQQLDDYLQRLRSELRATRAEVAEEVEQSVREHIEIALDDAPTPVSGTDMIGILDRLGSPEQWLGEEERAVASRIGHSGADDSRLPYVALGLVLASIVSFMFFGFLLLIPAMFVSRAWIEQKRERGEPLGSKRWLVYPSIALVLAFVALLLLLGPPLGAMALVHGHSGPLFDVLMESRFNAGLGAVMFGAWWIIAGALCAAFIRPIRFVFLPLLDRVRRKHFAVLSAIGALLAAAGAALMYYRH